MLRNPTHARRYKNFQVLHYRLYFWLSKKEEKKKSWIKILKACVFVTQLYGVDTCKITEIMADEYMRITETKLI